MGSILAMVALRLAGQMALSTTIQYSLWTGQIMIMQLFDGIAHVLASSYACANHFCRL